MNKLNYQSSKTLSLFFILFIYIAVGFLITHLLIIRCFNDGNPPNPKTIEDAKPNILKLYAQGKIATPVHKSKPETVVFSKTVNNLDAVSRLYDEIFDLPPYPTDIIGSCTIGTYDMRYSLYFYKENVLLKKGTMQIYACAGGMNISMDGSYKRIFTTRDHFFTLLEQATGLDKSQLFGN